MKTPRQQLGDLGERLAERFLRRKGHKLLARKFRCTGGEIDLITFDPAEDCICFVEVKSVASEGASRPENQVNKVKRTRLIIAARAYVKAKKAFDHRRRFDVIAVIDPAGPKPEIRHWPNAFTP